MPTTSGGVAYTTQTIDLGDPHGVMHITVADSHHGDTDVPTILYAHGAGGASDQFVTLPAWNGLRDWLLGAGWAIVEGIGGSVVGGQNWGNPAAQAAYPAYLARARTILDVGTVVLLGRSMGGLITSWLYKNDTTGQFAGWINNSGVSTSFVGTRSGPKDLSNASGWYFSPTIFNSWGVSNIDQLETAMRAGGMIPEEWDPTVWAGKNILCCYGDADTAVPWSTRGAGPMRTIWAGQPAIDRAALKPGGDHSGTGGSYLQVEDMVAFLLEITGGTPPEPPTPVVYVTGKSWLLVGENRVRYELASEVV